MKTWRKLGILLILSILICATLVFITAAPGLGSGSSSGNQYDTDTIPGPAPPPPGPTPPPDNPPPDNPPVDECNLEVTNLQVFPTHGPVGTAFTVSGNYTGDTTGGSFGWVLPDDSVEGLGTLTVGGDSFSGNGIIPSEGMGVAVALNGNGCAWNGMATFTVDTTLDSEPIDDQKSDKPVQDNPVPKPPSLNDTSSPGVGGPLPTSMPNTGMEMIIPLLSGAGLLIGTGFGLTRIKRK